MRKKLLFIIFIFLSATNAFGAFTFILPGVSGSNGTQITVPVKVKNFQNIISIQGTIQFDPAIVSYSSVQQFGMSGMNASSFGITGTSSGNLTFSWYDGALAGVSLADSSIVFSITFNIIGGNSQVSALSFVSTPTLIEVVDNAYNPIQVILSNGSITVQNSSSTASITLFLDSSSGTAGSQINVSMRALDFTNINSIQGTIQFDPTIATFSSISSYGLPGTSSANFGTTQVSSGKLTFTWYDSNLLGVDMADSTALFTIQFNLTCTPGSSAVNLINTPTLVEVTDSSFNTMTTTIISGSITNQALVVSVQSSPPVICNGYESTLIAGGASNYSWMPGNLTGPQVIVSPTGNTTYTVTGTSSACVATANVTVTVNQLPVANYTYVDNGSGAVTFANTSQNATSYNWDFGDGTNASSPSPTHTYPANGTYIVILTATNSCGTNLFTNYFTIGTTNIATVLSDSKLEVFPNPSTGLFNLKYDADSENKFTVKVINIIGELVFTREYAKSVSTNLITFDLSKYTNGIYTIEVINKSEIKKSRIIINK